MDLQAIRLPAPGDVVGDYRILGLIGDGGQGRVYRAEAFGKSYALKFIERGFDRWGEREVRALLALKPLEHPGVVRFIACGRWPDLDRGIFYVVMEYVEGLTLHDYVMIHNPSARKAGELVLSLGRTLLAVQEAGVLHRDVKPENIRVRLPGEEPVVLDFGLAALVGARSSAGAGPVTGTLEYLSPEAWRHARDQEGHYQPTPRDEQWALGVTFYWLLTDRLPFGAREDPLMTRRVLRETPKAPHVINPRVPPELGAICMRLLEKKPEDRYADLREMCGELRGVLEAPMGVATWDGPLGQPDAPECRTTEIDKTMLAEHGIDLALLKIRPPRRGRVIKLPVPSPAPLPEPEPVWGLGDAALAPGAAAAVVAVPVPVPGEAPLRQVRGRPRALAAIHAASRWAASWTMMLALGLVMGPLPAEAPSWPGGFQPGGEAAPFAAWQVGSPVQKLAIPLRAPESGDDATPNPASVVAATLPKDEPDVKKALKKVRKCVGVCCIAGAAGCVTTPTVVRYQPPPVEPCPDKAIQEMNRPGILPFIAFFAELPGAAGGAKVTVHEGKVRLTSRGARFPDGSLRNALGLEGRLFFGPDKVYGSFTKATTPEGEEFPLCAEVIGDGPERGAAIRAAASGASAVVQSPLTLSVYTYNKWK